MARSDLKSYEEKRDFDTSPEPRGAIHDTATGRLYIIQKHAARRLHYDLRLELDGVLKSWAIPKGPSLDPKDKRLAVHVEDHPVDYGSFEGIIPQGQYGGGTVLLWDRGEWEPIGDPHEGLAKGVLKFRLYGEKLHGAWALIRIGAKESGDRNWIIIKERDSQAHPELDIVHEQTRSVASGKEMDEVSRSPESVWISDDDKESSSASPTGAIDLSPERLPRARRASFPALISPQLATLVDRAPEGEEWIHEVKYDGYRILAYVHEGIVRLITRNAKDWTEKFGSVRDTLSNLPLADVVLDGEMVILTEKGTTDFQSLQNLMQGLPAGSLTYYVFDIIYYGGYDLSATPLLHRKEFLRGIFTALIPSNPFLRFNDHLRGSGATIFEQACSLGLEGIVSKKADSRYEQRRSKTWVKTKCIKRQEFVIAGFTDPSGQRDGFGALLLGFYDDNGSLVYCGRVGTGFDQKSLTELYPQLKRREVPSPAFVNPPKGTEARGVHWIRPDLIGEVDYIEWTGDGVLRHPSFKGLRRDKVATEVSKEIAQPLQKETKPAPSPKRKRAKTGEVIAGVNLSNPDRVLYPEQGVTKVELARFYDEISEWILPHLVNRPLTLVRCPEGRDRGCFYQKHTKDSLPPSIRGIAVQEKEGVDTYIGIDDRTGLIGLVQLAALEIHPWGSKEQTLEAPDRLIFDLDPGPNVEWVDVIRGAKLLKKKLQDLGLTTFVKTSGGKGLHVVLPVDPVVGWDEAKEFTRAVVMSVVKAEPDKYVGTMAKNKRIGKIFIDYVRNSRGATTVAPYSTRARQGCPVSTPIDWKELSPKLLPDSFTIRNLSRRLARQKRDPWEELSTLHQSITKDMRKELE